MTLLRRSSDPHYHATLLQGWAQRERKHEACDSPDKACAACFWPLIAELVANEVLASYGPTIGESERAGLLPDPDELPQTAIRPREPTAEEAAKTGIKAAKPTGEELAETAIKPKGRRRSTVKKTREEMLEEVRAFDANRTKVERKK